MVDERGREGVRAVLISCSVCMFFGGRNGERLGNALNGMSEEDVKGYGTENERTGDEEDDCRGAFI